MMWMRYSRHALATSACVLVVGALFISRAVRPSHLSPIPAPPARNQAAGPQLNLGSIATPPIDDPESDIGFEPFWRQKAPLDNQPTQVYAVRVIDSQSRRPISNAKVWVEIGDPSQQRNGYTDSRGIFSFRWRLAANRTKVNITTESQGYATAKAVGTLVDERVIQMTKAN